MLPLLMAERGKDENKGLNDRQQVRKSMLGLQALTLTSMFTVAWSVKWMRMAAAVGMLGITLGR